MQAEGYCGRSARHYSTDEWAVLRGRLAEEDLEAPRLTDWERPEYERCEHGQVISYKGVQAQFHCVQCAWEFGWEKQ